MPVTVNGRACAHIYVDSFLCCVTANSIQFNPIKRHHYDLGKTNIPSHLLSPLRPLLREAERYGRRGEIILHIIKTRSTVRRVMGSAKVLL